jgi:hypothetical protein
MELRSQELQELQNTRARSLLEIEDQHLPGRIFAKHPDSLAPELLQLLTPEFLPLTSLILSPGRRNRSAA